jgi:two-component system chemotaxis response regulator CheY
MVKTILLIDDDADEIGILTEAIAMAGSNSTCDWAPGPQVAYGLLQNSHPDLIFLDFNMPGDDGLVCLEALKRKKELQDIPVVMYSTYIDYGLQKKAMDKGAFRCIQKTTSVHDLVKELKQLFTQV